MDEENTGKKSYKDALVRSFLLIGFILILSFFIVGSIQTIRTGSVRDSFSSLSGSLTAAVVQLTSVFVPNGDSAEEVVEENKNEGIEISIENSMLQSGEQFSITWEHFGGILDGTYTFSYECGGDISFESNAFDGTATKIFCETPFNFFNTTNELVVTPLLENADIEDVRVSVSFTPYGELSPSVEKDTLVVVYAGELGEVAINSEDSGTLFDADEAPQLSESIGIEGERTEQLFPIDTNTTPLSNPNGQVDLAVTVLETGVLDIDTNTFTKTDSIKTTQRGGIRFEVINLGTKTSDEWTFNAVLPTSPSHTFFSDTQQTLEPGDRIEFTLGFDSVVRKTEGIITINVDPSGSLQEVTKDNNIVKTTIQIDIVE